MALTPSKITFAIGDLIKTSRPGNHLQDLTFLAYAPDRRLCVHTVLTEYLQRTLLLRGKETRLFITLRPPHNAISRDTLSRWIKDTMEAAGIDLKMFKPHSVRAASTSHVSSGKLPLQTILKTAGWSRESTFAKYYKKPIQQNYGIHLLEK